MSRKNNPVGYAAPSAIAFKFFGSVVSLLFTLCFSLLLPAKPAAGSIGEDLKYLGSLESRLAGSPGSRAASDYIEARFRALGMQDISREKVNVTVPVDEGSYLQQGGRRITIHPLWPNLVRTSMVPPEGLSGRLVFGGSGQLENFLGQDLKDSIVILDFNCAYRWLDATTLGARAVIFVEPEETSVFEARRKFLSLALDVPRFYMSRAEAVSLAAAARSNPIATVYCRQRWERRETYNLIGYLKGTDPELSKQVICLNAYYDSMSVVPELAPGAGQAVGVAALLDLAAYFSANPPKRTLLFLANGAHHQGLRGMVDFVHRHSQKPPKGSKIPEELKNQQPIPIKLYINLDLSGHSDRVCLYHNTTDFSAQRYFAPFAKKLFGYLTPAQKDKLYNGISPEKGLSYSTFMPESLISDGLVPIVAGIPSLSFVTIYDSRRYFDTPMDRPERIDYTLVDNQVSMLRNLLGRALGDPDLFPSNELTFKDKLYFLNGRLVNFNPQKSFVPNDPVPGALACVLNAGPKSNYGLRCQVVEMTDDQGSFLVAPLGWTRMPYTLEGYVTDPENGRIVMAPDRGVNGAENYPIEFTMDTPVKEWRAVIFRCEGYNLFDFVDPRYLMQLTKVDIFNPSNAIPYAYGYSLPERDTKEIKWTSEVEPAAVVFTEPGMPLKVVGEAGLLGKRVLLINAPESSEKLLSEGVGYEAAGDPNILNLTPYRAARDMINLNEFRINNFRRFGVNNERLTALHQQAREWFDKATEDLARFDWFSFLTNSRRAVGMESRAYPDVRSTTNDVIKGLIFYFVILLPFAFFSERLFFGFVDIRKQIAGVFAIFLVIFVIMRFAHPGFRMSNSPEVILLAFVILTLAGIVIFLISGKFEEQMQRLKMERAKVYETDVGRMTTIGTAFALGIANMKRRKMRTSLTAVTLILLTFTVLSFTSIKNYLQFNQIAKNYPASYEGMMMRDRTWSPLEGPAYEYVRNEFSPKAVVAPRAWLLNPLMENKTFILVTAGGRESFASGLLGLTAQEKEITGLDRFLTAGSWFEANDEKTVLISRSMAGLLDFPASEVGRGVVRIGGEELVVRGIFDESKLNAFRDLDGEIITPVDFTVMPVQELGKLKSDPTAKALTSASVSESFSHQEAGSVILMPFERLYRGGGTIQSLAIKFQPGFDVRREIEGFVSRLAVTVFTGLGGKTFAYSSLGLTSMSGIGNLFIPILIASLIVLNTMLGAVYERIREIGIYSSVGLAPSHIAALFFAEALRLRHHRGGGRLPAGPGGGQDTDGRRPAERIDAQLLLPFGGQHDPDRDGGGFSFHDLPGPQGVPALGSGRYPALGAAASDRGYLALRVSFYRRPDRGPGFDDLPARLLCLVFDRGHRQLLHQRRPVQRRKDRARVRLHHRVQRFPGPLRPGRQPDGPVARLPDERIRLLRDPGRDSTREWRTRRLAAFEPAVPGQYPETVPGLANPAARGQGRVSPAG